MAQVKNHEISSGSIEELSFRSYCERGERKAKILAEEKSGNGLSDLDEKTRICKVVVIPEKNNESESQREDATPEKPQVEMAMLESRCNARERNEKKESERLSEEATQTNSEKRSPEY